jgi:hypothetical protein
VAQLLLDALALRVRARDVLREALLLLADRPEKGTDGLETLRA